MKPKKFSIIHILESLTSFFLFSMFAVVLFGIIARYIMSYPVFWTDELARYLMFYVVMLGSAIALRENSHPSLTFVVEKLPGAFRMIWEIVLYLLIAIVLFVIILGGFEQVEDSMIKKTAALRISYSVVYFGFPLGGLFMLGETVLKIVSKIKLLLAGNRGNV